MTNKTVFLKWTKNMFYLHCASLLLTVLGEIPVIGFVFNWISTLVLIVIIVALFKLAPANVRYKKAAIFRGISVGVSFVIYLVPLLGMISIVGSICSFVSLYQEYCGHAEMLNGIDEKLSRKWHTLFNWNVFGGIVLGILAAPLLVVLGVLLIVDTSVITVLTLILITSFDVILRVIYLIYLKQTRDQIESFR